MKSNCLILIFCCITFIAKSQNLTPEHLKFFSIVNKGNLFFSQGNYSNAFRQYQNVYSFKELRYLYVNNYLVCCYKISQIDSLKSMLKFCISNLGYSFEILVQLNIGISKNDARFKDIIANESSLKCVFYSDKRMNFMKDLEYYYKTIRLFEEEFPKMKNYDFKYLTELKNVFDEQYTIPFMKKLITFYNFPNANDLGVGYDDYFYYLLKYIQLDSSIYNKALFDGKIPPFQYAVIMDRHFNYDKSKRPLNDFGTKRIQINGNLMIGEINKIDQVDNRRHKIGLPPIWQEIKHYKTPVLLSKEYEEMLKKRGITIN